MRYLFVFDTSEDLPGGFERKVLFFTVAEDGQLQAAAGFVDKFDVKFGTESKGVFCLTSNRDDNVVLFEGVCFF